MPYTTKQAAELLGLTEDTVKHYCWTGDLVATKFGHLWQITEEALADFQKVRAARNAEFDAARDRVKQAAEQAAEGRPRGRPPTVPPADSQGKKTT